MNNTKITFSIDYKDNKDWLAVVEGPGALVPRVGEHVKLGGMRCIVTGVLYDYGRTQTDVLVDVKLADA